MELKSKLRYIMDFPKKGIKFVDITTVLQDPNSLKKCVDKMNDKLSEIEDVDIIVGPESRGFIFGMPLAYIAKKGFVPVRKQGKLPYKTINVGYACEYKNDILEIHEDAILPGQNVVIVDDLLATGGTTESVIELIGKLGGNIQGVIYFIEIKCLEGRSLIEKYVNPDNIKSVIEI